MATNDEANSPTLPVMFALNFVVFFILSLVNPTDNGYIVSHHQKLRGSGF